MVRAFPYSLSAMVLALLVCGCSKDDNYSEEQRRCIADRFPKLEANRLDQCVAACKGCLQGTTVTCTTSCKLKGAS